MHSYCKSCCKEKSSSWAKENYNKHLNLNREWEKHNKDKRRKYEINKYNKFKNKMMDRQRVWQINNKDKLKEYQLKRRINKKHEISETEWVNCLDYFNNGCAYCSTTIKESLEKYGQILHKEHVIYNGANDLSNCVPSCKGCNSSKWQHNLEDWYNEKEEFYTLERYKKILKWLNEDYLNFIEVKNM